MTRKESAPAGKAGLTPEHKLKRPDERESYGAGTGNVRDDTANKALGKTGTPEQEASDPRSKSIRGGRRGRATKPK